jgi:hypothetical protein
MRVSRVAIILVFLAAVPLLSREAQRGYAAWLLLRGDFARLEGLGPETYFVPALRAYTRQPEHSLGDPFLSWATRQLHPVLPEFDVTDIRLHSSGRIVAALTKNADARERSDGGWQRLVAVDPGQRFCVRADSGPLDFGSVCCLSLSLVDVDGDGREEVFLIMYGMGGETGWLYRLERDRFTPLHPGGKESELWSWGDLTFVDLDHDGTLGILGYHGKWATCPTCGVEAQSNRVTWKLQEGLYRRWTIRGEDCGPSCEKPWTR